MTNSRRRASGTDGRSALRWHDRAAARQDVYFTPERCCGSLGNGEAAPRATAHSARAVVRRAIAGYAAAISFVGMGPTSPRGRGFHEGPREGRRGRCDVEPWDPSARLSSARGPCSVGGRPGSCRGADGRSERGSKFATNMGPRVGSLGVVPQAPFADLEGPQPVAPTDSGPIKVHTAPQDVAAVSRRRFGERSERRASVDLRT